MHSDAVQDHASTAVAVRLSAVIDDRTDNSNTDKYEVSSMSLFIAALSATDGPTANSYDSLRTTRRKHASSISECPIHCSVAH